MHVKISVKAIINTTNYLIRNSIGGMILTTICFGYQVAIIRLYILKQMFSTICKHRLLDVEISDTLTLFGLQIVILLCLV